MNSLRAIAAPSASPKGLSEQIAQCVSTVSRRERTSDRARPLGLATAQRRLPFALARICRSRVGAFLLELPIGLMDSNGDRLLVPLRGRRGLFDRLRLRRSLSVRHRAAPALAGPAVAFLDASIRFISTSKRRCFVGIPRSLSASRRMSDLAADSVLRLPLSMRPEPRE